MSQQTILVTGAASGIGQATARLFAKRGFKVAAYDVTKPGLDALAAELGADHLYEVLDVTDFAAYQAALQRLEERFGRLDVLFNCAGIMRMGSFEALTMKDHALTVQVNVMGVVHGTYAALPLLKKTPGSHVISMGSSSAFYGVPELSTYSASKFFVRGFTEAINIEFHRFGIQATDLMPLYVQTPMIANQEYHAGSLKTMGARLTAEQLAELVWTAAHGDRVHWVPTLFLKTLAWIGSAIPFANRPVMRYISKT